MSRRFVVEDGPGAVDPESIAEYPDPAMTRGTQALPAYRDDSRSVAGSTSRVPSFQPPLYTGGLNFGADVDPYMYDARGEPCVIGRERTKPRGKSRGMIDADRQDADLRDRVMGTPGTFSANVVVGDRFAGRCVADVPQLRGEQGKPQLVARGVSRDGYAAVVVEPQQNGEKVDVVAEYATRKTGEEYQTGRMTVSDVGGLIGDMVVATKDHKKLSPLAVLRILHDHITIASTGSTTEAVIRGLTPAKVEMLVTGGAHTQTGQMRILNGEVKTDVTDVTAVSAVDALGQVVDAASGFHRSHDPYAVAHSQPGAWGIASTDIPGPDGFLPKVVYIVESWPPTGQYKPMFLGLVQPNYVVVAANHESNEKLLLPGMPWASGIVSDAPGAISATAISMSGSVWGGVTKTKNIRFVMDSVKNTPLRSSAFTQLMRRSFEIGAQVKRENEIGIANLHAQVTDAHLQARDTARREFSSQLGLAHPPLS